MLYLWVPKGTFESITQKLDEWLQKLAITVNAALLQKATLLAGYWEKCLNTKDR